MTECDGSQYALAGSILISVIASIGAILKICASKGMYCESNCNGNPCICDTNEGRPQPHSSVGLSSQSEGRPKNYSK